MLECTGIPKTARHLLAKAAILVQTCSVVIYDDMAKGRLNIDTSIRNFRLAITHYNSCRYEDNIPLDSDDYIIVGCGCYIANLPKLVLGCTMHRDNSPVVTLTDMKQYE